MDQGPNYQRHFSSKIIPEFTASQWNKYDAFVEPRRCPMFYKPSATLHIETYTYSSVEQ